MTSELPAVRRRLLIADDAPPILSWVRRAFSRAGWDVLAADNGATAWEMWQASHDAGTTPDLLMTDLNMPGLDGSALMERVRAVSPEVPILVLTGLDADETIWLANSPAHTLLVRKPVPGALLVAAATALIDGGDIPDLSVSAT